VDAIFSLLALLFAAPALSVRQFPAVQPGTVATPTSFGFDDLLQRLERAVQANGLMVIAKPSASRNAAGRGIQISGNAVILAFNNDFALRLLQASVPAGFEAPMRLYVTENPDRTATVTYRTATALFAPYDTPDLAPLAGDLDQLFAKIVTEATRS
jgi:uncharacterized protein (DUF302 family)